MEASRQKRDGAARFRAAEGLNLTLQATVELLVLVLPWYFTHTYTKRSCTGIRTPPSYIFLSGPLIPVQ